MRTLTSFMGLRGIFDCLIDRPLSPIFFIDVRGVTGVVFILTGETQRQTELVKLFTNHGEHSCEKHPVPELQTSD